MATPESKVKAMIKRRLREQGFVPAGEFVTAKRWYWMPVAGAIGTVHGIPDYFGLDNGFGWGIEAKANTEPTANQLARMSEINAAGGFAMVVRTEADMDLFFEELEVRSHGRESLRAR